MFCLCEVLKLLLICRFVSGNIVRNDDFVGDELFMAPESERVVAAKSDDAADDVDYVYDDISNSKAEVWAYFRLFIMRD